MRVLALLRPNASSSPLLQEATLEARNPVSEGWVVGFLKFWDDTEAQKIAEKKAAAEAERHESEEVRKLLTIDPQTQGLNYDIFMTLPVIVRNEHWEGHKLKVFGTFLFPDGELWHTESRDFTVSAYATEETSLDMSSAVAGEWEILFNKYIIGSNSGVDVSLIEWQLVIDGEQGETYPVNP